jgi:hypothetical protein
LTFAQKNSEQSNTNDYKCGQDKAKLEPLIKEAESGQYIIRRIEIVGAGDIRYQEFNKRMASNFHEGYEFTRKGLVRSVSRVSKMRAIYQIGLTDVELRLNRENKDADLVFCVKERPKRH